MRISDWSSDVCSSDLTTPGHWPRPIRSAATICVSRLKSTTDSVDCRLISTCGCAARKPPSRGTSQAEAIAGVALTASRLSWRSEEHTSELQSLMRISYAVSCLKQKKEKQTQHNYITLIA